MRAIAFFASKFFGGPRYLFFPNFFEEPKFRLFDSKFAPFLPKFYGRPKFALFLPKF